MNMHFYGMIHKFSLEQLLIENLRKLLKYLAKSIYIFTNKNYMYQHIRLRKDENEKRKLVFNELNQFRRLLKLVYQDYRLSRYHN